MSQFQSLIVNELVGGAIGYTDSKFAVRGMTKAAAVECAHYGIRVNSVHPGVIATPMIAQDDQKALIEEFAKQIPLKRIAESEEITESFTKIVSAWSAESFW